MSNKICVLDHKKYGRGVFAKEKISSGEIICVMGGHILDTDEENRIGEFATEYNMDISENFSFCPKNKEDLNLMPQHLINHSCNPNCGFLSQCEIAAIKDIEKGDEVCYDYAFVMYSAEESKYHFVMECGCQSDNCRKKITESDWKIKDLQDKYYDFFQPFIKIKIKK